MRACQPSPTAASVDPAIMNGFGPKTGRNRCDTPAPIAITTVTGRKARPAWMGV